MSAETSQSNLEVTKSKRSRAYREASSLPASLENWHLDVSTNFSTVWEPLRSWFDRKGYTLFEGMESVFPPLGSERSPDAVCYRLPDSSRHVFGDSGRKLVRRRMGRAVICSSTRLERSDYIRCLQAGRSPCGYPSYRVR